MAIPNMDDVIAAERKEAAELAAQEIQKALQIIRSECPAQDDIKGWTEYLRAYNLIILNPDKLHQSDLGEIPELTTRLSCVIFPESDDTEYLKERVFAESVLASLDESLVRYAAVASNALKLIGSDSADPQDRFTLVTLLARAVMQHFHLSVGGVAPFTSDGMDASCEVSMAQVFQLIDGLLAKSDEYCLCRHDIRELDLCTEQLLVCSEKACG